MRWPGRRHRETEEVDDGLAGTEWSHDGPPAPGAFRHSSGHTDPVDVIADHTPASRPGDPPPRPRGSRARALPPDVRR